MKQVKSGNKPLYGGGEQNTVVDVEDASCNVMMVIPTEEWDDLPYHGFMLCQTSSKEFFRMDPIIDKSQELFSHNKCNENIIHVGDNILYAASESGIDGNLCLLDNQST